MYDISVNIANYIPSDRYKINVYRTGSQVPVAFLDVDINAGPSHVFRELASGYTYDVEVLHYCAEDPLNPSKFRKPANLINTPNPCSCPSGYTAAGTICVRKTDTEPQSDLLGATAAVAIVGDSNNNINGIRVYNVGFTGAELDNFAYESQATVSYWRSSGLITNGRLNIAGVSAALGGSVRTIRVLSKLNIIGPARVIYLAFSSSFPVRVIHNGAFIIATPPGEELISKFHACPVFVYPGENVFEIKSVGATGTSDIAVEIYDCALQAIQEVDTGGEGTLNRLFTTIGYDTDPAVFYSNLSCFPGYTLVDIGSGTVCRKIEYSTCL